VKAGAKRNGWAYRVVEATGCQAGQWHPGELLVDRFNDGKSHTFEVMTVSTGTITGTIKGVCVGKVVSEFDGGQWRLAPESMEKVRAMAGGAA
jgi:hypothetical protein